jgi:hypothetical protein
MAEVYTMTFTTKKSKNKVVKWFFNALAIGGWTFIIGLVCAYMHWVGF